MKVEVDNQGGSYALTAAVLIYTDSARSHAIATKHVIDTSGGAARITPGAPLTVTDYSSLVRALAPQEQPAMLWHDQSVLASGMGRMIWFEPPQKRSLFFKESSLNQATFTARGVCATPGLVFMACLDPLALYVFAVKGSETPSQDTQLYQAPFFNVWSRGQICMGNSDYPREEARANPDAWSKTFFGSHFTHPNFTQEDRLLKGVEPIAFWQKHLAGHANVFPEKVLVELPLRVRDLMAVDYKSQLGGVREAAGEF
jgi:PRTRC genetic system protein B